MNEEMEAKAQELDPTRSRTIGSYVIGTSPATQAKLLARGPLEK
jgi:hypothetical protein